MAFSPADVRAVDTIRVLSADMVQQANSGHPGAPIGLAPVAHVLFSRVLKFNPANPKCWNRDRFVLSNGHASALQYSILHLLKTLTTEDVKGFRQLGSKTPGHPENLRTPGIEVTTGPLGQGIANAVGMAIAEKHLAATYNKEDLKLFSNSTFAICGDGCLQEGIAQEAISLAGTLQLGKLVLIYDNNHIQIDGSTDLAFSDNTSQRFLSLGWNVLEVTNADSNLEELLTKINEAKRLGEESNKPTVIIATTTIGFGTTKAGTAGVHGSPLGKDALEKFKASLSFDPKESFVVPEEAQKIYDDVIAKGAEFEQSYNLIKEQYKAKYPEVYAEIEQRMDNNGLPGDFESSKYYPVYKNDIHADGLAAKGNDATRNSSGIVLNYFANALPSLFGGSADLTPSNKTFIDASHNFDSQRPDGRYMRWGVREHGMVAMANGLHAYGGFIPFTATFLNFVEYSFGAVRVAALAEHKQLLILTHDSIGVGEDGPTHQPIEVLSLLRATPNLLTMRPADINEVSGAYHIALKHNGPTAFCLSRQNVKMLPTSSPQKVAFGAYKVSSYINTKFTTGSVVVLIASGTELDLARDAANQLVEGDVFSTAVVVSAPCLELFDEQSVEYRQEVLPRDALVVSIEPFSQTGWEKYAHRHIAMSTFGESAPAEDVYEHFGFSGSKIAQKVVSFEQELQKYGAGKGNYPLLQAQYIAPTSFYKF